MMLKKLIDAGHWAPSSCNRQPQKFLIFETEENKKIISSLRREKSLLNASALILVLIDLNVYEKNEVDYTPYLDAAAAIQNILLMAHALGLGGCWFNFGQKEIRKSGLKMFRLKFKIPKNLICISLIALGYPIRTPMPVARKSIEDLIIWESF